MQEEVLIRKRGINPGITPPHPPHPHGHHGEVSRSVCMKVKANMRIGENKLKN